MVVVVTASSLLGLLMTLGLNVAGRSLLARLGRQAVGHYVALSGTLAALSALLLAGAATLILPVAGVAAGSGELVAFAAFGSGTVLSVLAINALYGLDDSRYAYGLEAITALAQVLLAVALIPFGPAAVIAGLGLALLAQGAVGTHRLAMLHTDEVGMPTGPALREFARTGARGISINLGTASLMRVDRYLLGVLATGAAVGYYSVAATYAEILLLLPLAVANDLSGRAAASRLSKDSLAKVRRLVLLASLGVGLALVATAPAVIPSLFGPEFDPAVAPTAILLLATVALSVQRLDSLFLMGRGYVKVVSRMTLGAALTNAVANLALIPSFDVMGAALSSLIAYLALAAATRWMVISVDDQTELAEVDE